MPHTLSKCRSCGAEIIWCVTENGKAIPVTAKPNENGNIKLVSADDPREPFVAKVLKKNEQSAQPKTFRYISHFVDCPNAAHHRRK